MVEILADKLYGIIIFVKSLEKQKTMENLSLSKEIKAKKLLKDL
jgi:hypothetical protein